MNNPAGQAEVRSGIFSFDQLTEGLVALMRNRSIKDGWPTVKVPSLWCGVKLLRFLFLFGSRGVKN